MNNEELVEILQDDFHYPSAGASVVAKKIMQFQPELLASFTAFIQKGELPQVSIEGYDLERLMNEFDMTPIAGFLTLDWLMRDPEEAKLTLERGYDTIKKET